MNLYYTVTHVANQGYEMQKYLLNINDHLTYTGGTANKYRAGVLSFGVGPFRTGGNSEKIREVFQNRFAHDILTGGKAKWFQCLLLLRYIGRLEQEQEVHYGNIKK